jgi:hypothetical protein
MQDEQEGRSISSFSPRISDVILNLERYSRVWARKINLLIARVAGFAISHAWFPDRQFIWATSGFENDCPFLLIMATVGWPYNSSSLTPKSGANEYVLKNLTLYRSVRHGGNFGDSPYHSLVV